MSDKESTLQLLETEYQSLRQTIDGLDEAQLARPWLGTWAVRDIIAHVLGWEREMTSALQRLARGDRPTAEGVDYSNFDEWNAKFAREMAPIDPGAVLATWHQVHTEYVRAAQAVPDDRYGEGKTVNRLLEGTGVAHYREHGAEIREWRDREGL